MSEEMSVDAARVARRDFAQEKAPSVGPVFNYCSVRHDRFSSI